MLHRPVVLHGRVTYVNLLQLTTHNKNLKYFRTKKHLNRILARWSEFLTHFDYHIQSRLGILNGKAVTESRRPGNLSEAGDHTFRTMDQVVLKIQNLPKQLHL